MAWGGYQGATEGAQGPGGHSRPCAPAVRGGERPDGQDPGPAGSCPHHLITMTERAGSLISTPLPQPTLSKAGRLCGGLLSTAGLAGVHGAWEIRQGEWAEVGGGGLGLLQAPQGPHHPSAATLGTMSHKLGVTQGSCL